MCDKNHGSERKWSVEKYIYGEWVLICDGKCHDEAKEILRKTACNTLKGESCRISTLIGGISEFDGEQVE